MLMLTRIRFLDDIDYSDCIPKKVLNQLSSDVAKLKAKGGIDTVNKSKLTLLINLAMRNVDLAKNLQAGPVSFAQFLEFWLIVDRKFNPNDFLLSSSLI